jgi:hypothetical protein
MTWLRDTAERVIVTFLEAWLAAWMVIENVTADKLFEQDVLMIGLLAAVGAFLKALAATNVGRRDSASLVE